jgi:hypothetical protein
MSDYGVKIGIKADTGIMLILFKKYHDLPSITSCEHAAVVFVRNSPEYTTPWTQSESSSATYKRTMKIPFNVV